MNLLSVLQDTIRMIRILLNAKFVMLEVTAQHKELLRQYRVQSILKTNIALREASRLENVRLDILLKTKKPARLVLQASIVGQHQTMSTMA